MTAPQDAVTVAVPVAATVPPPVAADEAVCANCGTHRVGPWCHGCGQHEDAVHRSLSRLGVEALEHLVAADGKIVGTLRRLARHPGGLTRDYLAGKRAAQLPPLQLFVAALLAFLFIAELVVKVQYTPMTSAQAASVPGWIRWIFPYGNQIHAHHQDFTAALKRSAESFGFLTVPVAALLLWGLFAGRRWRLYDHVIFALHSLTAQLAVVAVLLVLPDGWHFATLIALALMAAHLYVHMRGTYRRPVWGTLATMAALAAGTAVAFTALFAVWIVIGYWSITG